MASKGRDFAAAFQRIREDDMEQLEQNGYVIVDGFLGTEWATALRDEICWLKEQELMFPNQVRFLDPNGAHITVTKPKIHELDLHHADRRDKCPELSNMFANAHHLAAHVNELRPDMGLITSLGAHTLKVQFNEGGGAFPWHHDNPGKPDKRRLSCLLYLNPDWSSSDGGEIRVASFLQPPITVEPKMDRLVLFYSENMLHRVNVAHKPRYCLTIWLESHLANNDSCALPWPGMSGHIDSSFSLYAKPSVQRKLSRAVYAEEYEKSIRECMGDDAEGLTALLLSHQTHLTALRKNVPVWNLVEELRLLKASLEEGEE